MPVSQPKEGLKDGAVLCSRYAYMPNQLQYCGGDDNFNLFEYASTGHSDTGLTEILEDFATLYPYLKLIAETNKIEDIFDWRVTEAYWLGNSLLQQVQDKDLYRHMTDVQQLKKKLKPELFKKVVGTIPKGALPHHNFHVISVPKRTGHYPVEHTLETMDACKISWGKVREVKDDKVLVDYYPLVFIEDKLALGNKRAKWCQWQKNETSFVRRLGVGDLVSLHWNWVCDRIAPVQQQNLKYYTQLSINLANSFWR